MSNKVVITYSLPVLVSSYHGYKICTKLFSKIKCFCYLPIPYFFPARNRKQTIHFVWPNAKVGAIIDIWANVGQESISIFLKLAQSLEDTSYQSLPHNIVYPFIVSISIRRLISSYL